MEKVKTDGPSLRTALLLAGIAAMGVLSVALQCGWVRP